MRYLVALLILLAATISTAWADPYAASTVITNWAWDTANIDCSSEADDSDNWPLTWHQDGDLYMGYGDGEGWVGTNRVAAGLAKVSGSPSDPPDLDNDLTGTDLDDTIADPDSRKFTGILDIGGAVLYTWTRGAPDNGCLRKSTDDGATLGACIHSMEDANEDYHALHFIQFGAGYTNTRDDYVYMYATNQEGTNLDRAYLIRVDISGGASALEDEANYEYYTGTFGGSATPTWSFTKSEAVGVIYDPGYDVYDIRAVYNPNVGRYFVTYNDYGVTTRTGFITVLEAAEPWGPWFTVYQGLDWTGTSGWTFEYEFPQKWMSGTDTMFMVFSGTQTYGKFCVAKATFTYTDTGPSEMSGVTISKLEVE